MVDNLTNMVKFKNIQGLKVMDYMDKIDFAEALKAGKFAHEKIDVIFHEGACSDTMEYNGKYMMQIRQRRARLQRKAGVRGSAERLCVFQTVF